MKSKKQSFPINQRLRLSECHRQFMEKFNKKNFTKNSPRPSLKPPEPVIQRTKTLKKHNYFESNISRLSSNQKISQRSSPNSSQNEILDQLASYMKENNNQQEKKSQFRWEEMQVEENEEVNRTLTVINKKSQVSDDDWDDFFDESNKSTEGLEKYKYKEKDQLSESGTESVKSSQTEVVESFSMKRKKQPEKKKGEKKSDTSSDSSTDLINLAMKHRTQTQQQESNKLERKAKKSVAYSEDAQVEEIWQFIQQMQGIKKKNTQKPRKSSQDYSRKSRNSSPPIEVNKFQKRKNNYLTIDSPEQISKKSNNPNNRRTFVVSNQKNKQASNSISNIFGNNNRDSEYKVKRLKKQKEQETTCSICLCDIEQRSKLPCKHSFCRPCLVDWIDKTSNCPNCRKNADFYTYNGEKYKIQQKTYSLENYVDNIGDQSDDDQVVLDCECYNCDRTQEGDELLVCDRCLVNASHVQCDPSLKGKQPPAHRQWYCHVCRAHPNMWYREMNDY